MINASTLTTPTYPSSTRQKNTNKVSIFYYNDTHGNSDQMAGLLTAAKAFNQKALTSDSVSFVLSAGDNYSGGDVKKNGFIVNLMQNAMKVFASAVGNHEIDGGLNGLLEAAGDKKVQFVATNAEFDDKSKTEKTIKKSLITEKDGVKFGFIGAMPTDFKECTKSEVQKGIQVFDFEQTVLALQKEINNLRAQGVNKIILLSHSGYENDKRLAQSLDGVDIIVGGHTHKVVEGAKKEENIVKSKSGEPVIITQAGENGKYYGILNVEFNPDGTLKVIDNELQKSTNSSKSPSIEYIKNSQLGVSPVVGKLDQVDPMPKNRRIEPLAWTCAMADSMRAELGADIALVNSANIRKVPQAGTITERDITESAPMKNELIKTKLTQKQLVDAIQNAARKSLNSPNGEPGLLQGSGFGYKVDSKGNLLEFNIINNGRKIPIDFKNPSDSITYTAIYDTFTSKADGETPELAPRFEVQKFDFDKDKTMIDYISKRPDKNNLKIVSDGRIQIIKT